MAIGPVTAATLGAVHDPAYVDAVLAGQATNGFGTRSEAVSRSILFPSGLAENRIDQGKWEESQLKQHVVVSVAEVAGDSR